MRMQIAFGEPLSVHFSHTNEVTLHTSSELTPAPWQTADCVKRVLCIRGSKVKTTPVEKQRCRVEGDEREKEKKK